MDLNSPWVKASGPALIALIAVGAIMTGAYSTDQPAPIELSETAAAPLPDDVRYGAIEIGPVAPDATIAGYTSSGSYSVGSIDSAASVDPAALTAMPLWVDGYIRYLEVGAYPSRSAAEAKAASVNALARQETRMGDVAVVYAPEAISDRYRVHIGPFEGDVTNDDVRVFKDIIGEPNAVIVSIVKSPSDNSN